jgi:glutamine cyclotransferase
MNKKVSFVILIIILAFLVAAIVFFSGNYSQRASQPIQYTCKIIDTYPHDTTAFTEGLLIENGALYESTGINGESSLRRVDLQNGAVLQEHLLSSEYFGEGLAAVNGTLVQLTWLNHKGFVYDEQTFQLLNSFSYTTEGWGLTYDGDSLIMSDGTQILYFLDPVSYALLEQVTVKDGDTAVTNINELEYVNGELYANIWRTSEIAIIDPTSGDVKGWVDLSGLYQPQGVNDVLNGIAYDTQTGALYVTGKNWPNLYQIELVPKK